MPKRNFFGRKKEIDNLLEGMKNALSERGKVLFISGEAGSGKTSMVTEFTKFIPSDAIMIKVGCNAQTGIGNPYFPFKQILSALMGDIDSALQQERISENSANLLSAEFLLFIDAVLQKGPDLLDALISKAKIIYSLEQFLKKRADRKAKDILKSIIKERQKRQSPLTQSDIFEEMYEVLNSISRRHPLVLILDDLHWADSATLNLLLYLGRRFEKSKILFIGTFRPEELQIGRDGHLHPLEKILSEFKYYYGNSIIDLDNISRTDGKQFIDSVLDSEANVLDSEFREMLFHHTNGHALFTLELIEAMKEKGLIYKNNADLWTAQTNISWPEIPARIEGVIEERINHLEPELHQILSIASVEGEDFTAEVVAQVRELSEKMILRQLSQELEKKHRLVREQGALVVNHQHLQKFQFSHALFQQYFYTRLGKGQRRVFHEEIANILEKLYEGDTDEVILQLVHHYKMAGNEAKAMIFLIKAGDMAANVYAFTEARYHYKNAQEILSKLPDSETNRRKNIELIFKYMTVSSSSDNPNESIQLAAEAEKLINRLIISEQKPNITSQYRSEWEQLARIYLWTGRAYYNSNQLFDAIRYYNKVIPIAQGLQNEHVLSMATGLIGRSLATQGHFQKAASLMMEVQSSLEQSASWHDWIWNTEFLSSCLAIQGKVNEAFAFSKKGLVKAEEINYLMAISMAHSHLALVYRAANKPDAMLEHSIQATKIAEQSGDRLFVYIGYGLQAWASLMQGNMDLANKLIRTSLETGKNISDHLVRLDWFTAVESEIAFASNNVQNAIKLAEKVIKIAQPMGGIFSQGMAHRVWGQCVAILSPHSWDQVESHMNSALHFFQTGNAIVEMARTHVIFGNLFKTFGELGSARIQYLEAESLYKLAEINTDLLNIQKLIIEMNDFNGLEGIMNLESTKLGMQVNDKNIINKINWAHIRDAIMMRFNDPQLDAFCMDNFPDVYNRFSRGLQKDEKINMLIDHCRRSPIHGSRLIELINNLEI